MPDGGRPATGRRAIDLAGAITTGLLLLVYTVVEAPAAGWTSARTAAGLAGAAALIALFVAIERRVREPLVRLGILRSGPLVRANLGAMALFGSWVGFPFIATLYLQGLRGWSPLETGLAIFPGRSDRRSDRPRTGAVVARAGVMDGYPAAVGVSLAVAVLGLVAVTAGRRRAPRRAPEPAAG